MRLGIISDTHGLLWPQVHEIFKQVDRILHAGDVGGEGTDILDELALIAPVTAVYGNVDGALRGRLNGTAEEMIDGFRFVITHGHELGARVTPEHLKERFGDADVIVFGHTHKAVIRDFPDFSVAINPILNQLEKYRIPRPFSAFMLINMAMVAPPAPSTRPT